MLENNKYLKRKKLIAKTKILTCPICGLNFISKVANHKFCSRKCAYKQHYQKSKHHPLKCKYCGIFFTPKTIDHLFCSKKCQYNWHNLQERIKSSNKRQTMKCSICGCILNDAKTRCKLYCNNCHKEKMNLAQRQRYKPSYHTFQCINCGKTFISKRNGRLYCSLACSHDFFIKFRIKEITSTNILPYLSPEREEVRKKIIQKLMKKNEYACKILLFSFLGNKCEVCGTDIREILTIHHVNPQGRNKKPTTNCRYKTYLKQYENGEPLRLLCFNHHKLLHCKKLIEDVKNEK